MVHQIAPDRSPRKRDRRVAGLSFGPPASDANVGELSLVGPTGTGAPLVEIQPPPNKVIRLGMYDTYQPWVLQTYGDQAKTKTITRNKYQRILQILRGDYIENESSKFKLWVKGRGFRIGPPPGYYHPSLMDPMGKSAVDYNPDKDPCPDIYVQTGTIKDADGNDRVCFKKVAIVEDFFEIVYNLHVCRDGKEQKHMGQKRTYRAVSERYAFVPREAVTKFLVLCTECPRRSVGVPVSLRNIAKNLKQQNNNNNNNNPPKSITASTSSKISPPSIPSSMGAFTSPLGTSLLGSSLLGVTLPSNHPGMILSSAPQKAKNNFSSVVSLVGNGTDALGGDGLGGFSGPPLQLTNRRTPFAFTPADALTSIHPAFSTDAKMGLTFDAMKLAPNCHPTVLQPLSTAAPTAATTATTPPPRLTPVSPPKVVKSAQLVRRGGPFTPEGPGEGPPLHFQPTAIKEEAPRVKVEVIPVSAGKHDGAWVGAEALIKTQGIKQEKVEDREIKEEAEDRGQVNEKMVEEEEDVEGDYNARLSALSTEMNFNLPITTLYMKHIKNARRRDHGPKDDPARLFKDGPIMGDSDVSEDELKNAAPEKRYEQRPVTEWTPYPKQQEAPQQVLGFSKGDSQRRSPCVSPGTAERAGSGTPLEIASNAEETSSNGNKDDEDDDNDDDNDDEKIDAQYDPERLKAFNMFVRLFVDENLDRIVPISKQPKEKIQAIIDACARQFPEFAERTRKRIRTYLKSCRRNKRTRDSNGWETSRPTPPHLTSIQAEQILATACENEAQNAKRMRLGLEPVSQPNPLTPQPIVSQSQLNLEKPLTIVESSSAGKLEVGMSVATSHSSTLAKALERPLGEAKGMNGASIFQTSFQNNYQKVSSALPPGALQQGVPMLLPSSVGVSPSSSCTSQVVGAPVVAGGGTPNTSAMQMIPNGPTDLSLKGTSSSKPSNPRPALNAVEVAAVRQLITGYRESAAFLLRSADELENLLVHQQNP